MQVEIKSDRQEPFNNKTTTKKKEEEVKSNFEEVHIRLIEFVLDSRVLFVYVLHVKPEAGWKQSQVRTIRLINSEVFVQSKKEVKKKS